MRLQSGEVDCTYPPKKTPLVSNVLKDMATPSKTTSHFYTQWRESGGTFIRFEVTVGSDSLSFVGEAKPELDPYFIKFSPSYFMDDHMIDVQMQCQPTGKQHFYCEGTQGSYRKGTVIYQREKKKIFDLSFYGIPDSAAADASEELVFRIYSDGRYIHTVYYRNAQAIERLSEHYPIAQ